MAWVSPKVYAILSKSEEGKDILEGIADKDQAEVDKEVDAFFGKGGKGYKSNAEYSQAKIDDEAEEERYKAIGDEEISEKDYDGEEYKVGDKVKVQGKEYTITKIEEDGHFEAKGENGTFGSGNLKDKTGFGGNPISIEKIKEDYSLEEAKNADTDEKKLDDKYNEGLSIIKEKGFKDDGLSSSHRLLLSYAKGEISEEELVNGFREKQKPKNAVIGKEVETPEDADKEEKEYERNKKQFKDFIVNHENYKPMVSAIKTQQGLMDKLNKQGFLNSIDNKKWYDTTKKIADLTHKIEKDYEDKIGMNHFMSASAIAEYELMKGK